MGTRLWIAVCVTCVFGATIVGAEEPAAVTALANTGGVAVSRLDAVEPWVHPSMPAAVKDKIETGFAIAMQRVTDVPQCAELFQRLGADPLEILSTGLYFPATPAREVNGCRRAMAQTYVGDAPTWICRRVTSHSDERVALVLIHEALHHAGLTEKPHDPKAMSSGAINSMVAKHCGL